MYFQHLRWVESMIIFYSRVPKRVEHTETDEHLEEIAENLIVERMLYTISIATNNRTRGIYRENY